ncbi:MAG: phosphoglycerate kinase [Bdellovibrionales bacterium]
MAAFQTISDLNIQGQRVLVRADLNVPMKDGAVSDDTRLIRFLPTLIKLRDAGAKIVILSHFGRPKGQREVAFSLRPVGERLAELLGSPISFADDCIGDVAHKAVDALQDGDILLLENTRFYKGETDNDPIFAQKLAMLGDVYVNDAFSAAHRAHASTEGIAHLLPSAAGLLMEAELNALGAALEQPEPPVAALVGGAKISTKLDVLHNLIKKTDLLILGGGMANTFLAAQGKAIGKSLYEAEMLDTAREIMKAAEENDCRLLLPNDVVVASALEENIETQTVSSDMVPADKMILDVGLDTIAEIKTALATCRTIIWNGPLGVFEIAPFDQGTSEVAQYVAQLTDNNKMLSVAGGGDTVAALSKAGVLNAFSYVSTAGGAFLEWMEGKTLPGVKALEL